MKVIIPSPLLSYTRRREVEAAGSTLAEVVADLDRRYPGLRFRIVDEQDHLRPHVRVFVNAQPARDLATAVGSGDEVQIVQALSGG
ncbi:MAG TPA: MoaD/ThiS family protein [Anaeromyxobacteraceae bacterium]|nr:MoaD/ThiS family protein [Anaeromyxobacteraceae bacterium]